MAAVTFRIETLSLSLSLSLPLSKLIQIPFHFEKVMPD